MLEFLETQFEKDAIGPELEWRDEAAGSPLSDSRPEGCVLNVTDTVVELQRIFFGELPGRGRAVHLGRGMNELSRLCEAIFTSLPPLMAKSVQTLAMVPLAEVPPTAGPDMQTLVSCIKVRFLLPAMLLSPCV